MANMCFEAMLNTQLFRLYIRNVLSGYAAPFAIAAVDGDQAFGRHLDARASII